MNLNDCIRHWRAKDKQRQSLPGEHLMTAAAGGALIVASLFAPTPLRATLRAVLGTALLVRAASGRDGLAAMNGAPVTSAREPWLFPTSGARAASPASARRDPPQH